MHQSFRRASSAIVIAACVFASTHSHATEVTAGDPAATYVDSVKAALNRGKHFPTGREVSLNQPSGRSEVTFALTRAGKVTSVKTTQSSNSMPLDEMARTLVHRAKYPAFPAVAWAGESAHTFVVAYNFTNGPTGKVTIGEPVEVRAQ